MNIYDFNNRAIAAINRHMHKIFYTLTSIVECLYLRIIGVKIEGRIEFRGWTSFFISRGGKLSIGDNCKFNSSSYSNHIGLNHKCIISCMSATSEMSIGGGTGASSSTITCFKKIKIGKNVRIGANCIIMDGDFHLDDPRTSSPRPITIGDNVWLGAGVVVMKGVTIGENTVIGINSVVTKDIPANCIAVGTPCKVIKSLEGLSHTL